MSGLGIVLDVERHCVSNSATYSQDEVFGWLCKIEFICVVLKLSRIVVEWEGEMWHSRFGRLHITCFQLRTSAAFWKHISSYTQVARHLYDYFVSCSVLAQ